jgi:hypothetical protein
MYLAVAWVVPSMENMRMLLRGSLGRSLSTMPALERLTAAWPVACGTALSRTGVIAGFAEGILTIEVTDRGWMEQLLAMRAVLEQELARIAEVKLAGIHFQLAKLRR